jgi:hypothetical protein
VPDTVAVIIWAIAGVAGGNAAGELLKGDYDLGPGNAIACRRIYPPYCNPSLKRLRLRAHFRSGDSSHR